jgi:hypothetical protein
MAIRIARSSGPALDNARLLIREITEALERGTQHWAVDGRPLLTVEEILKALLDDGKIEFKPR